MAYDLLFRRSTSANWARRASTELPQVPLPAPLAPPLAGKHRAKLRGVTSGDSEQVEELKLRAQAGDVAAQKKLEAMRKAQNSESSGGSSSNVRNVRVGGPDDPLVDLTSKQRSFVATLIALRKKADVGDPQAQKIVEAVARLQIFALPPGLPAADATQKYMVHGR